MSQVAQTPEQQVYLSKLQGYDYSIQYKVGKSNVVADALSRVSNNTTGQFLVLSMPNFVFLEQLCKSLNDSHEFLSLPHDIQHDPGTHTDYKIHQGLILYKGKLWLDSNNPVKHLLLEEFHTTPLGGHVGVSKTLRRLQVNFYWNGMHNDIKTFIAQCSTCQKTKYETKRPAGLLQPLPIPFEV